MRYKTIHLKHAHEASDVDHFISSETTPSDDHYDLLVESEHTTVFKPNGEVLFTLLPGGLNLTYVEAAFQALHDKLYDARSSARPAIAKSATKASREGVFGAMDALHRFNFCRLTALTMEHLKEYKAALPMIRAAAELMKEHAPIRYAAQLAACEASHPDYIIPFTPFSTLTVNRDVTALYHVDQGDYRAGLGVLSATWAVPTKAGWRVVTEPPAEGGIIVFPRYRVAVKVRTCDVLLADVHEVHGVTPILGVQGKWARLSYVLYLREKIPTCGSLVDEVTDVTLKDDANYKDEIAKLKRDE